jgi:hypothetical protein
VCKNKKSIRASVFFFNLLKISFKEHKIMPKFPFFGCGLSRLTNINQKFFSQDRVFHAAKRIVQDFTSFKEILSQYANLVKNHLKFCESFLQDLRKDLIPKILIFKDK